MSNDAPSEKPRRSAYRHGDLAAAAARATFEIVEAEGAAAVSLRKVAGAVGVAHRSLYNHFDDREALLRAAAALAAADLLTALRSADDPEGLARAYLGFALSHPELYDLAMGRISGEGTQKDALRQATDQLIDRCLAVLAPDAATPDQGRRRVLRFFMLAHGGVSLHRARILAPRSDAAFLEEMAEILRA